MSFTGVVIEESLRDPSVLQEMEITATLVEPVTEEHHTPWLEQWTLHDVGVPDAKADEVAEALGVSLESGWYADFKNPVYHYVVFPGRVFKVERKNPDQYQQVVAHGLSLGIPDHQLDFSPAIQEWERPDDT